MTSNNNAQQTETVEWSKPPKFLDYWHDFSLVQLCGFERLFPVTLLNALYLEMVNASWPEPGIV